MKVLGVAGSPRRGGNTDLLLEEVLRGAASEGAEVKAIYLNNLSITACQHCDWCLQTGECRIQDDMQTVYREMESADRLVLASPVQFMGLTAQMKACIDRCQALWARKYVLKRPPLPIKERKGFFVAVGGMRTSKMFEPALATVKALFRVLDIQYAGALLFAGVDEKGAITREPGALEQAFEAGRGLVTGQAGQTAA